ncbi:MAG: hypothetical protein ACKO23_11380 [Gemmataceae bacterium]
MKFPSKPKSVRTLTAYAELSSYVDDFRRGHYPFLWILGRPGTSKSSLLTSAMKGTDRYYARAGQLTPLQLYLDLYEHRGQPVILDDLETLLNQPQGHKLINALGEMSPEKTLSYRSTTNRLGDVPESFRTTSPLCVISNQFPKQDDIISRALVLEFRPTNLEVHLAAAEWFWDQEVYDFFGYSLNGWKDLESRWYVQIAADKRAGRDWRRLALEGYSLDYPAGLLLQLEHDTNYPDVHSRARRFEEMMIGRTGGSRASYYRLKGELKERKYLENPLKRRVLVQGQAPDYTTDPSVCDGLNQLPRLGAASERPLDLPARSAFQQPIRGDQVGSNSSKVVLDDLVSWESRLLDRDGNPDTPDT